MTGLTCIVLAMVLATNLLMSTVLVRLEEVAAIEELSDLRHISVSLALNSRTMMF